MPRVRIDTESHVFFVTLENSLLLKINNYTPRYIFRDVLPDTSDMFSSRMILSAICSFFFYFFSPSTVLLSLSTFPSGFISAFSLAFSPLPLSPFCFCFMVCFSVLLCCDSTQSLLYRISKLNLTKTYKLFITTTFLHIQVVGELDNSFFAYQYGGFGMLSLMLTDATFLHFSTCLSST